MKDKFKIEGVANVTPRNPFVALLRKKGSQIHNKNSSRSERRRSKLQLKNLEN
jgi:hypothetical protein